MQWHSLRPPRNENGFQRKISFVDTDSEDDPTLFEWFPAEDIRRQSVDLMNLGLDREVTTISRSVDGDPWPYAIFK